MQGESTFFPSTKWDKTEGGRWGEAREIIGHRNISAYTFFSFAFKEKVVAEITNDLENGYGAGRPSWLSGLASPSGM